MITIGTLKASVRLHRDLLSSILSSTMAFFDTTPVGRIINRFSKDMDEIDLMIPTHLKDILSDLFSVLGTLFVVCYSTPIIIAIVIPLIGIFLFIQTSYLATSRNDLLVFLKKALMQGYQLVLNMLTSWQHWFLNLFDLILVGLTTTFFVSVSVHLPVYFLILEDKGTKKNIWFIAFSNCSYNMYCLRQLRKYSHTKMSMCLVLKIIWKRRVPPSILFHFWNHTTFRKFLKISCSRYMRTPEFLVSL